MILIMEVTFYKKVDLKLAPSMALSVHMTLKSKRKTLSDVEANVLVI